MKVHLIKKSTIANYIQENANSRFSMESWIKTISEADWSIPGDIFQTFNSADILSKGCSRVVFNVGGNKYSIICSYKFGLKRVDLFVKWIGDHKSYTALCSRGKQYSINSF